MDVMEAFRRAAEDREHGAAEIEGRLLEQLLRDGARWSPEALLEGARLLRRGQPMMANLRSLVRRIEASERGFDELGSMLERRRATLVELPRLLASHAWPRVREAPLLLSVSRSSAVVAVVAGAVARGWTGQVVVFDGTAAGGGMLQVEELATAGAAVRSEPDGRMAACLDLDRALVVVGADAVGETCFLNATGTRALLELAARRGLCSLLVADSAKNVEDGVVQEMLAAGPRFEDREHDRSWPVFERCPLGLVSGRVDETGCQPEPDAAPRALW